MSECDKHCPEYTREYTMVYRVARQQQLQLAGGLRPEQLLEFQQQQQQRAALQMLLGQQAYMQVSVAAMLPN